jgi:hypothetical protein
MSPFGAIQGVLRLVDGLLPTFSLLLPGGLFLRPFTLAGPLLPFVGECGLPLRRLVDWPGGSLLRLVACRLAAGVRRSTFAAQIAGQFGMLAERSVGSDGTPIGALSY